MRIGYNRDPKHMPYDEYVAINSLEHSSSVSTLKWMLEKTMGCPSTFAQRKMEMESYAGNDRHGRITDEDVLQSFRSSVDPNSDDP